MSLTVSKQVVLLTAGGLFFCLATAEPRPLLPELRVKLCQDQRVVFDLCVQHTKRCVSNSCQFTNALKFRGLFFYLAHFHVLTHKKHHKVPGHNVFSLAFCLNICPTVGFKEFLFSKLFFKMYNFQVKDKVR